jgi:hypothetical protein
MKQVVIIAVLGLCLPGRAAFASEALDVKPFAELLVMEEDALAYAAARACSGVLLEMQNLKNGQPQPYVASPYLMFIGLALIQQHKLPLPKWYMDTRQAASGDSIKACFEPYLRLIQRENQKQQRENQKQIVEAKQSRQTLEHNLEQLRNYKKETPVIKQRAPIPPVQ